MTEYQTNTAYRTTVKTLLTNFSITYPIHLLKEIFKLIYLRVFFFLFKGRGSGRLSKLVSFRNFWFKWKYIFYSFQIDPCASNFSRTRQSINIEIS